MRAAGAEELRQKLRDLMGDRGQEWLASELGVHQSTVSRFLSGRSGVTPNLARGIVQRYPWLKPDIDALFFGRDMHNAHAEVA